MRRAALGGACAAIAVITAACATTDDFDVSRLAESAPAASEQGGDPFPNWPIPPEKADRLLASAETQILMKAGAGGGTTGALRVEIRFEGTSRPIGVKWKEASRRIDGINNAPRKEIAAWELQRLFLDPEDYVVPTTAMRCALLDRYPPHDRPTVPGTRCVLGAFAIWLEDVRVASPPVDPARFREDALYARFAADLNLFTYLFDHQDARSGNFLVATDPKRPQLFSIDNGVAMNPWPWYNWFVRNWNDIRVPALRRTSVDRLRKLERPDLDGLLVVQQLEVDEDGIFRDVEPGSPLDPGEGVTLRDGTLQLGLTRREVDEIWERIEDLLEEVDEGEIPLF